MQSYNKSSKNYIDHFGAFLDKARTALIDEDGFKKEDYDIYFVNDEPTEELLEFYSDATNCSEDKIHFLEQLT
jgi:hypothetical protein